MKTLLSILAITLITSAILARTPKQISYLRVLLYDGTAEVQETTSRAKSIKWNGMKSRWADTRSYEDSVLLVYTRIKENKKTMNVSAYCPCEKCCGEFSDGVTASGHKIQVGDKLIAAPQSYPFGTKMYVPGYGEAIVEDRGGAIKEVNTPSGVITHLDVYFDSHQAALNFGRQELEVIIY